MSSLGAPAAVSGGNPPKDAVVRKVEFLVTEGVLRTQVEVCGQPDHRGAQACRGERSGPGVM